MKIKDKINRKYLQISLYVIITAVIIYVLSLLAKNAPAIFDNLMGKLNWLIRVIRPVILGFIFAYLMDPLVNFFESKFLKLKLFKRMKRKRTWAAIISVAIFFIAVAGLISLLIFSVTDQIRLASFDDIVKLAEGYKKSVESLYNSIIQYMERLDIQSGQIEEYVEDTLTVIMNVLKGFAESIISAITNISNYLTTIIFGFIIGFYFIIDGRMIKSYLKKVCYALFSENTNRRISIFISDLDYAFSGYVRGQLTDAFVMMILISLVLSVVGVRFAIVIGIFAGLGNLIPYFGPIVAYISTALVCIINGEIQKLVIALAILVVVQFVDGNFIGPKLLSKSIKIHPLIIIVSLIFGNAIGGLLGMLLAVPVGAYIKLILVRFVDYRIQRKEQMNRVNDEPADSSGTEEIAGEEIIE